MPVKNAAHAKYSLRGFTNDDEKEFAQVLDFPTFYPDFLWWAENTVYALARPARTSQ